MSKFLWTLILVLGGCVTASFGATLTVTNTNNTGAGSLRQTIVDAAAGDTIIFALPLFGTAQTIQINGQITINKSLTIAGRGANLTTIRNIAAASATSRVLLITSGTTVSLSGVTITGGNLTDGGGGIFNSGGTLNLTHSTVSGNSVSGASLNRGGGIYNAGTANARNTIISGNAALNSANLQGSLSVNDSNIVGNEASVRLAPLGFYGGATMTHALLSGSSAINAGNNCVTTATCPNFNAPSALSSDQRGAAYVGQVDIGAFEAGATVTAQLPAARLNQSYSFTLIPEAGTTTYCRSAGSLPPGISGLSNCPIAPPESKEFFTLPQVIQSPLAAVTLSGTPTIGGNYNFTVQATNGGNSTTTNYQLQVSTTTAANARLSGRVLSNAGRGVRNALVTLTKQSGEVIFTRTNSFGGYEFGDLNIGQDVVITVTAKEFSFAPQVVNVSSETSAVNFVAQ